MKRTGLGLGLLFAVGLVGWLIFSRSRQAMPPAESQPEVAPGPVAAPGITVISTPSPPAPPEEVAQSLPGEIMLQDFGDPGTPPANDLKLMAGLIRNMGFLVKSLKDRPLSGNEDWAAALRGANPGNLRFLPDQHRVFNAEGLVIDRWGTPFFFHPVGYNRYELRSAGPDKKMWTADDIQRNDDGDFRGAENLNTPGLYDPLSPPGK